MLHGSGLSAAGEPLRIWARLIADKLHRELRNVGMQDPFNHEGREGHEDS
jgi:hypothetical protein